MPISQSDSVVLMDAKKRKVLIRPDAEPQRIKRLGYFAPKELVGCEYFTTIRINNKDFMILAPSVIDKVAGLKRTAQIILPKDSALIALYCDIRCGSVVVEGGIGSGALTIVLAHIVRPTGKVVSYEIREEFAECALANLRNANLAAYVELKRCDITVGIAENDVDAVVVDIQNPQDVVEHAKRALKQGGHFCAYTPTTNQVELVVRTLRAHDFKELKTIENIQREIVVGAGVRPSFEMLGHTGYLTFARKF